jgi:hypothetical protein
MSNRPSFIFFSTKVVQTCLRSHFSHRRTAFSFYKMLIGILKEFLVSFSVKDDPTSLGRRTGAHLNRRDAPALRHRRQHRVKVRKNGVGNRVGYRTARWQCHNTIFFFGADAGVTIS